MVTSLQHFSHRHPLILIRKEVVTSDEILCYGCHQPILPRSPASTAAAGEDDDVYICGEDNCDDGFYLHKKCAESPKEIQHPMHDLHRLTLHARPPYFSDCSCNVCKCGWEWFTYNCVSCGFDVCMRCANNGDRSLQHDGHSQHILTLMRREALFKCDACNIEGKDLSYACNSCDFWMHKTCAETPKLLEAGNVHRHPLSLTYSLPVMHRNFYQKCRICSKKMHPCYWLYYCDECTYFGHIKCVAQQMSSGGKDEAQEENMEEDDLVRLPVDSKESFIHLMIDQFTKWNLVNTNINLEKSREDHPLDLLQKLDGSTSTGDHPQTVINDWSHKDHLLDILQESDGSTSTDDHQQAQIIHWSHNDPLELLQELVGNEQVEIICNGCIQPIKQDMIHSFYGCIKCNFFLHKFCLQLPPELPAGAFSRHPQHLLVLSNYKSTIFFVRCATCGSVTNGFLYFCEICDIRFDIRCCFLPNKIKHQSHNHPLVHSAPSNSGCLACGYLCTDCELLKCERMSCDFQIDQRCALLPATMRHRWDPHPIFLIYPPFDHQGLIYCEICEEQINTNFWLYHCSECDHSFHINCFFPLHNMKVGDCKLVPGLHKHILTFVENKKDLHLPFLCSNCSVDLGTYNRLVFECVNCDMSFCVPCVWRHL